MAATGWKVAIISAYDVLGSCIISQYDVYLIVKQFTINVRIDIDES